MKKYFTILVCLAMFLAVKSQTLTVNAPSHVTTGDNFRLSYTVNTQSAGDLRIGKLPEGLELIAGPYRSEQSSYLMNNGHTSSSSSVTFTFIVSAAKAGNYTIPAARLAIGGKTIASSVVKINVSGTAANTGGAPRMHNDNEQSGRSGNSRGAISGSDLFIKVSANKTRVYEQEPVLLIYKVYTLVDLSQLEGKMPDLNGFHTQEVKLPQQKSFHIEKVNGRNYRCVTWSQYIMYPQMTGKLEIPSITFNGIVVQQNRNVDPFEAFLNGGSGYIEIKRSINAPGMTINVEPLPTKPDNFSGGVGKFNISAQLDNKVVKAGTPLSLRITVGGNGNLKLIKQPVVLFPKDFDKYDPKITDKTMLTSGGLEGNMIYEFLAVPRNKGKYTIPAVEFIYFDTDSKAYKTIKTQPFEITVEEGNGTAESDDFMDLKNQDIRQIKTGDVDVKSVDSFFFGSVAYLLIIGALLVVFVTLMFMFRKRAIYNSDLVMVRGKKANKVATKRLQVAKSLMFDNRPSEFYDEVLRALWGYVSDKFNVPAEYLSRENINEILTEKGVVEGTISQLVGAIDECEYQRYAPGDAKGNMSKTFESAMTAIMRIEETMKKTGSSVTVLVAVLIMLVPVSVFAENSLKSSADNAYHNGNYQQAVNGYEQLLKKGVSPEIYYNLGNAYYRSENITKAIINYERALLLSPGDDDIRFNLQLARSKTIDKITPESEMFFVTWYRSFVSLTNVDGWAYVALASLLVSLCLALVYLFSTRIWLRKVGFFVGLTMLLLFVVSNICAFRQRHILDERTGAVIVSPSVNVKSSPEANATDVFLIHEGTKVDITDDSINEWKYIHLADGREGWISVKALERI
ncbi:BatD family protein [Prevotella sp. OH937_COT-195]|uniref:BatD family protein n=1 Tax=Prevotella sp. OH937_COT-195 TaxID=2491051 RepID=UPI000F64868B|nr:BatD family protein [Prevotella sp. OH937_COT-195]RRD02979.1 tetratricopeptide repeat protein [Prevotella sp. OH937_COT-195]